MWVEVDNPVPSCCAKVQAIMPILTTCSMSAWLPDVEADGTHVFSRCTAMSWETASKVRQSEHDHQQLPKSVSRSLAS